MTERTVVITGATGGIGGAICDKFYQCGWRVIASDRTQTCSASANSYVPLDLARMCTDAEYSLERVNALCKEIPRKGLNALINNAAVQIEAPFEALHVDAWRKTLDTNLLAPALLTRLLLEELEAARGAVLNVASIHAYLTKPRFSAYATSKAGLVGLTRALAVELGGRVRVNAICPAAVYTPMLAEGFNDGQSELSTLAKYHPSGSIGTPDEVAEAAIFLAGTNSTFLTGAILGLDGAIASRLHDPS